MAVKRVLIVGGYGSIGSVVSRLSSESNELIPIIAGRDSNRAEKLAEELKCEFLTIDIHDEKSIELALKGIDIIICCYVDPDNFSVLLAEKAIEKGCHYIDVSGRDEYNEKIIALSQKAAQRNVILITGLGLNPGIIGLLIADSKNYFEKIGILEVFFVMGGKMNGFSELSLYDLGYMIEKTPMQYNGKKWKAAKHLSKKKYMGEPFDKRISFYPGSITPDISKITEVFSPNRISIWTGAESFFQGLFLYFGVKKGYAKHPGKLKKLLKLLKLIGKGKNNHCLIKIIEKGSCSNIKHERIIEFHAGEELLTAIAPVIACEQIAMGDIQTPGAFFPTQSVDTDKFFNSFKEKNVDYRESIKKFKILSRFKN